MSVPVAINKLSAQLGLTSRTLRHWESEGLFNSTRDNDSGWRVYDTDSVLCIEITALLRKIGIPLKDIKVILTRRSLEVVESTVNKQLMLLEIDSSELIERRNVLNNFLSILKTGKQQSGTSLVELNQFICSGLQENSINEMEDFKMNDNQPDNNMRFVTLPPMRMVYNTAISASPEDQAMAPVLEWLEESNLMGTARLFGGNVEPFPSKGRPEYGYGMCASIPEGIEVPSHLKEMRQPGGLYAMMPSSDDIYGSWQLLMKSLSKHGEYKPDRSRLCFEEHIRNDSPKGQGSQFELNLLEPVKKK